MKNKLACLSVSVLAALSVTGCANVDDNSQKDIEVTMPKSTALTELRSIAVEAKDEMRLLAKAQEAQTYKALTPEQRLQTFYQSTVVPKGFEPRVTFSYVGNANLAAKAIAQVSGYRYIVRGRPFINEPQVNIYVRNQPLNEALRELGSQTGDGVSVQVDQAHKTLTYKYLPKVK